GAGSERRARAHTRGWRTAHTGRPDGARRLDDQTRVARAAGRLEVVVVGRGAPDAVAVQLARLELGCFELVRQLGRQALFLFPVELSARKAQRLDALGRGAS